MNSTLTLDYPNTIPDVLHESKDQFEQEAKMAMAVKLFKMKRLSSGMAASLAGFDFLMQDAIERMQAQGIYLSQKVINFALKQVDEI